METPIAEALPLEVRLDTEVTISVPQSVNVPVRVVRDEDVPVVVENSH